MSRMSDFMLGPNQRNQHRGATTTTATSAAKNKSTIRNTANQDNTENADGSCLNTQEENEDKGETHEMLKR